MPSHIRVSRDPLAQALVRTVPEETRGGGDARSRSKPPSYQHKMLRGPQFPEIVHIPSSYFHLSGQHIPQNPTYPVPRVNMKSGPRSVISGHHVDLSPFPEANASVENLYIGDTHDKPSPPSTFSPYIGASEYATVCRNAWILQILHD
jgi:hypothetical protein